MPPSGGVAQTGTGHSYQTYQDFSYEESDQAGGGGRMAAGGGDPMPKLTPHCGRRVTTEPQLSCSLYIRPS